MIGEFFLLTSLYAYHHKNNYYSFGGEFAG
jgi:hypothetical protein